MRWAIERDQHGRSVRLWWCGADRERALDLTPLRALCPRCRSPRWRAGRCLDCWYHAGDGAWRPTT